MSYSKKMGAIFVGIPKTGSTSLTHVFSEIIKDHDADLSFLNEKITPEFRSKYSLNEIKDQRPGRAQHLSAIQLKYILGEKEFDRCFKFSIVRNPWARMVTRYFYKHKDNEPSAEEKKRWGTTRVFQDLPFDIWVEKKWKRFKRNKKQASQLQKLVDLDGNIIVDYVGRLEHIQQSLDEICDALGVRRREMPHVNSSGKRPHYSTYYNEFTMEMIHEICQEDIECFDFDFDFEFEKKRKVNKDVECVINRGL